MKLTTYRLRTPLKHPFTIARGTIDWQHSLIVQLEDGRWSGWGEVTVDTFYGHSFESMERSLESVTSELDRYRETPPEECWDVMLERIEGDAFAMSALDMAAHDWWGQRAGQPSWQRWELDWDSVPESSFTIGLDTIETMVAKLEETPGWGTYKIKLGAGQDLDIVRALRERTDAVFRVDANCGWTVEQTVRLSRELAEMGVEFIEQPLPITATMAERREVFERSALPVVADEDCQVPADVGKCKDVYHGINVKLCKCGGLTPALRMLREARASGLKTMVGCMVETAIGISGAAQLLPLLDWADLDGQELLADSPTRGVSIENGKVGRPSRAGNGAVWEAERAIEFLV